MILEAKKITALSLTEVLYNLTHIPNRMTIYEQCQMEAAGQNFLLEYILKFKKILQRNTAEKELLCEM